MGLKRFEDYAKEFDSQKKTNIVEPEFKKLKSDNKIITPKVQELKVNENSFLVGADFKVKVVIDVPQALVQEYINKVKDETDKDPLDNFSEAEIAEQIVTFLIKKNLIIDNLTPEFTVGSENVGNTEKSQDSLQSDADALSDDLGDDSEQPDSEIEFDNYNDNNTDNKETVSDDEVADGEIEFDTDSEKKDLGEEREIDKEDKSSDPDSNFDEIEFESDSDNNKDINNKPKTVGDLKKSQGQNIETQHKKETSNSSEEEEEINDMYKKIGYKVGYFESINLNNLRR